MGDYFKVCDICWAHVSESHLEDHKRWHRNLSNLPMIRK